MDLNICCFLFPSMRVLHLGEFWCRRDGDPHDIAFPAHRDLEMCWLSLRAILGCSRPRPQWRIVAGRQHENSTSVHRFASRRWRPFLEMAGDTGEKLHTARVGAGEWGGLDGAYGGCGRGGSRRKSLDRG
jgi:hypothetical protein